MYNICSWEKPFEIVTNAAAARRRMETTEALRTLNTWMPFSAVRRGATPWELRRLRGAQLLGSPAGKKHTRQHWQKHVPRSEDGEILTSNRTSNIRIMTNFDNSKTLNILKHSKACATTQARTHRLARAPRSELSRSALDPEPPPWPMTCQ